MSPNVADALQYRHLRNTALPFITATAPTSTEPNFVAGSNILTSYKGYVERRPGFGTGWESAPTTFAGTIKRVFTWRRWGGQFYIMLCAVSTSQSIVYKLNLGVDASFASIFTSASTEPFDFVVSNNFCFFGNGTDMRKYDGTTVTNWGISIGVAASNSAYCGTGADAGGPNAWTNPTNIQGAPNLAYATNTVTAPANGVAASNNINATNYGFGIGAGNTIIGFQVVITGLQSVLGAVNSAKVVYTQLMQGGVPVGSLRFGQLPTSAGTLTLGGSSDLWGTTWTPALINAATFGVTIQCSNGNGFVGTPSTVTFSLDAVQVIVYSQAGPAAVASGSAGTFSAANGGYQYVYCYSNASTGHISSPTPPSPATGNFTNKLNVGITVVASSDPQVTNIRLFRTTDGGGGVFFEVASSPYPNSSGTITDTTADASLSVITAPTFGFNDPPPAMKGMVWFANRIWGFNNASVYFTDWEEMNIGVPEEASVSGSSGNFWNFDSEVTGLSIAQDGVIIFTAGGIFKIDGDSLDTFRRTTIAKGIGCRNRATITRLGALTAFLANTNSIWTTDSTSLQEISAMIQPNIDGIDHSQASMIFHIQGQNRWLLLCDPSHSQTLPYDVNTQQWMPPWTIVPSACMSGETTPGNWDLLIGDNTSKKMLQLTTTAYLDNGASYAASLTTNLIPIVNEHMSNANPVIDLYYPQAPEHVAYIEYLAMDSNAVLPTTVKFLLDEDPATGTYTDITANVKDAPLKNQGVNIVDKWYYSRSGTAKRCSTQVNWAAANSNFKVYTYTYAYRVYR